MPRQDFGKTPLPSFDDAPSVILVAGKLDFFVEEAAAKVADALAAEGAERIRFDDDALPGGRHGRAPEPRRSSRRDVSWSST